MAAADLDAASALELFSALCVSRAAQERLKGLEEESRVRQAPRRPAFREAGPVAAAYALRRRDDGTGDVFAPTFRAAGALGLLGFDLRAFFRSHVAGEVGPARGPGAELHHVDHETGLLAPVVPLGILVEVVAGITLGFRLRGDDRVGVVFDTDGATSTGAWHEGLVFAAARRCPMVVVVEVDETDADRTVHTRVRSFLDKAPGYGLGAESVDGADVLGTVEAVRTAVDRARAGEGVQMVEIRYSGDDPVAELGQRLRSAGVAADADLDALRREAEEACDAALADVGRHETTEEPELRGVYTEWPATRRRTWADPRVTKAV